MKLYYSKKIVDWKISEYSRRTKNELIKRNGKFFLKHYMADYYIVLDHNSLYYIGKIFSLNGQVIGYKITHTGGLYISLIIRKRKRV